MESPATPGRNPRRGPLGLPAFCLLTALIAPLGDAARAQTTPPTYRSADALKRLSLEELFEQEVISASRRPESLAETASHVVAIEAEEIRRSGATTLPQALRLAPVLQVAQINAQNWAISARGFNDTTGNKLLVMIDGRSVYTPLFSGVFWDAQQVFLPDVERIEVISGPGSATWGANAVNGVINILSRPAADTQGSVLSGWYGNEEGGVRARYGGGWGDRGYYRVYAQRTGRAAGVRSAGGNAHDEWTKTQAGFRADWEVSEDQRFTLQGDVYSGRLAQRTADHFQLGGANVLGRWTRAFSSESTLIAQVYFDATRRFGPGSYRDHLDTIDLDVQHQFAIGERHDVVWGFGYRWMDNRFGGSPQLVFLPEELTFDLATFFVQDEYSIVPDRLRLSVGSKFEQNDFSGFEYQPSVRLAWLAAPLHTVWASISRAVRTPSRVDRDLFVPGTAPFLLTGGPNFESEIIRAYEIGYRAQVREGLTFSTAIYHQNYDRLRSVEPQGSGFVVANGLEGESVGAELLLEWQATEAWRWSVGANLLDRDIRLQPWSRDLNAGRGEGHDPRQQYFLGASVDLPHEVTIDAQARWIDDLPTLGVPSYAELDCRAAWRPRPGVELSIVGQNLLDRAHPEFGAALNRVEIERSVYGMFTWEF